LSFSAEAAKDKKKVKMMANLSVFIVKNIKS